ncbi:MAG TPA: hypothetical protein VIG04_08000 [Gemmatimonadales bacterium]|jgi:hypothetical protein
MTADYNGWNDAPETEREAMDVYFRQESERESDHSPLTFRQQGIIAAVSGAVMLVFYTLMGVL